MEPKSDVHLVALSVFDIFVRQLDEPSRIAVMYDCDDRYIAINAACLGVLQLTEADVLGHKNAEIISDTAQVAHIERMLAATRSTRGKRGTRAGRTGWGYQSTYVGVIPPVRPERVPRFPRVPPRSSACSLLIR